MLDGWIESTPHAGELLAGPPFLPVWQAAFCLPPGGFSLAAAPGGLGLAFPDMVAGHARSRDRAFR